VVDSAAHPFTRVVQGQRQLADNQREGDDENGPDEHAADEGGSGNKIRHQLSKNRTQDNSGENGRE
jgi:hypothetical protein